MARIVLKFGGTSVGDTDRIRNVARKVKAEVARGNQVAVVVSAMSGATNQLVKWGQRHRPAARSPGVRRGSWPPASKVTIGLLALALQQEGVKARSWVSWQIPIKTDNSHARARILDIDTSSMALTMAQGEVPGRARFPGRGGPTDASPPWGAADPILRQWRWLPRSRPSAATSTPTSTASTRRIPASWRRHGKIDQVTLR
jgi:aspartate kinase